MAESAAPVTRSPAVAALSTLLAALRMFALMLAMLLPIGVAQGHAAAISDACLAINDEWGSGRVDMPFGKTSVFKDFLAGEVLTYSFTTQGSGTGVRILQNGIPVEEITDISTTIAGTINIYHSADEIEISVVGDPIRTVTYDVTCAAGSPAANTGADITDIRAVENATYNDLTLSPTFDANTGSYTVEVDYEVTKVMVGAMLVDFNAVLTINGARAASMDMVDVPVNVGANTITFIVTSADEAVTKTYTVIVTRADPPAASTEATLANLSTSTGTLTPSFSSGVTSYTMAVANSVDWVGFAPTTTDSSATVTVGGNPVPNTGAPDANGRVDLDVGDNIVTIVVTAADGMTTNTYTVTVTRAAPVSLTMTPAAGALPDGTVGNTYSVTFTASGGGGPYSYAISGGLPDSLMFNQSLGTISGSLSAGGATAAGDYSFDITATDATDPNVTVTQSYTLHVEGLPAPAITSVAPASGPTSGGTSITITGTGFTGATSVTIGSSAVSAFTVVSDTQITATTAAGTAGAKSVTVTTPIGIDTRNNAFTYANPTLALALAPASGTTLPVGTVGVAYNRSLSVSGGVAPYTFTVTSGALPAGLSINASGRIIGTPTATTGALTFSVTVTDANGAFGVAEYHLGVNAYAQGADSSLLNLVPSVGTLSPAFSPTTIDYTITVLPTTADITLTPTVSQAGATVTVNGISTTSGQPSAPLSLTPGQTRAVTVYVTSSNGKGLLAYSVFITRPAAAAPAITAVNPASGPTTGGTSITITGTGFTGATGVTVGGSSAPGITVVSDTQITATTPPGTAGAVDVGVSTPSGSDTATGAFTYTAAVTLSPVAGSLPDSTSGTLYSKMISASGGTGPYSYAITSGTLPAGLTIDASTGEIKGRPGPATAGGYSFTVTATDSSSPALSGSANYSMTVKPAAGDLTLSPPAGNLTDATVGTAYSVTITASGFYYPFSYSITSGSLPAGLTLNTSTGVITGTPTTPGTYTFTVMGADSYSPIHTGSAVYSLTVNAPAVTFNFSPAAGTLPAGEAGTAYTETISASGGTGPYSYSVTSGTLPAGLMLDPETGEITGTPTVPGNYSFTVEATDSASPANTGTATYDLTINAASSGPVITNISPSSGPTTGGTTVIITGPDFSRLENHSNSVSFGGVSVTPRATTPTGALVVNTPAHAAGTVDVTVTTNSGTTIVANAFTFIAPATTFSPAAGALPAGMAGTAYSQTVTASGGTAPYSYAVTSGVLPAGLTLNPVTGTVTGTPTIPGSYSFTVTATDSASPANTGTATYSLVVDPAPVTFAFSPAAGTLPAGTAGAAYTETLSASGGTGPYSYSVTSGTLPAGLTLNPATGEITGTPTVPGNYSFTVTATDSASPANTGTATYSLVVDPAPVTVAFSPAAGTLPAGEAGTAYSETVTTSGGTAPYSYAVTAGSLPAGVSLNPATGEITGTPTIPGNYSFTVTATDSASPAITGTATYAMTVNAPAVTFTFSPAAGTLKEAMAGEEYNQSVTATGGRGTLIYSLVSGSLPRGMVLNISTGELTGPIAADAEARDYTFTIQARDANGSIGTAAYTITVAPRAVTVTDKVVDVPAGSTPADVYLNRGATGGPFVSADMTFVEPANVGTATIIQGQLAQAGPSTAPVGWYLQFTPNPAYSGQVRVGFRLTSALGISNNGTVTYNINYNPAQVASEIDGLVHDFVRTRQNLIATTIKVPGLLDRRRMAQATDPVTARIEPSERGMTVNFSTSLAQMEAARDSADGVSGGYASPFNIWINGAFLAHSDKDTNGGKWGSFAMLSAGADYLLSDKALLGLSFHYDRMSDPTNPDAELTGNGWLAGPYTSFEIGKNLFWNASVLYGGSANDIDTTFWDGTFDTTRLLLDTSVEGQWDLGNDTLLAPRLRAVYFSENVDDYTVKNSAGDAITIDGFNEEQFRISLGAEIARSFTLDNGSKLTPKLGVTGGFSGLDGSGAFGSVTAGVAFQTADQWTLDAGLLLNIEGDGQKSVGGRVRASKQF